MKIETQRQFQDWLDANHYSPMLVTTSLNSPVWYSADVFGEQDGKWYHDIVHDYDKGNVESERLRTFDTEAELVDYAVSLCKKNKRWIHK